MKAAVGDLVYVAAAGKARVGTVTELRHPDGTPPYVVRWLDTGAESVLFPRGPALDDVRVVPRPRETGVAQHRWAADIELVESGRVIHVVAGLVSDDGRMTEAVLDAGGTASVPRYEAEALAVAQALERLAADLRASAADPAADVLDVRTSKTEHLAI